MAHNLTLNTAGVSADLRATLIVDEVIPPTTPTQIRRVGVRYWKDGELQTTYWEVGGLEGKAAGILQNSVTPFLRRGAKG